MFVSIEEEEVRYKEIPCLWLLDGMRRPRMINKFKVYDKELGRMYEPDEIFYIRFHGNNGDPAAMRLFSNDYETSLYCFVVLNYSGFKDSRGVEIYEKDILECSKYTDFWYEVRYSTLMGVWEVVEFDENGASGDTSSLAEIIHDFHNYPNLKIFGNDLTYKYISDEEEEDEDE
jgi:hypothetical protein